MNNFIDLVNEQPKLIRKDIHKVSESSYNLSIIEMPDVMEKKHNIDIVTDEKATPVERLSI